MEFSCPSPLHHRLLEENTFPSGKRDERSKKTVQEPSPTRLRLEGPGLLGFFLLC